MKQTYQTYIRLAFLSILSACILCQPVSGDTSPATRSGNGPAGGFTETTRSHRPGDTGLPASATERTASATAWRGERVNFQILLWAGARPLQARATATSLKTSGGATISADCVHTDFLKFIAMNKKDRYASAPEDVEMVPDMLNGAGPVVVQAGKAQPLWVAVDVPRDARPGKYRGKVLVKMGTRTLAFPVGVRVLPLQVPPVKDWTFRVGFWIHPQAALHYYLGCECRGQDDSKNRHHPRCAELMWSDRHLALYKPTLIKLRDAGMKNITVNLSKDPWLSAYRMKREQHQTNYPYDEMIRWRRKSDGRFSFDFSAFEKYVRFCVGLGIDGQIECYSMLPWVNSQFSAVSCFNETSGKRELYYFKDWDDYHRVWSAFMREFVPVLKKNGWFEKTVVGVDERGLGNMRHVQNVLKNFKHKGKALRLSAAADKAHGFDDGVHHVSMSGGSAGLANNRWSEAQYAAWAAGRRAKGLVSTWYTCTGTYPGNFGNSRPAESLFIGWYSARIGADGYLRWAVDSWNDNPTETTDHKVFETGDTFQLYPGDRGAPPVTRSSVRFELFRQGVVDFEKIRVLRAKFPGKEQEIRAMLAGVTRPARPAPYPGNSSLQYTADTEHDFSDITKKARQTLLRITLDALGR